MKMIVTLVVSAAFSLSFVLAMVFISPFHYPEAGSNNITLDCSAPTTPEKKLFHSCPRVSWHAQGRSWHSPATFPLCSMDSCFDYSRCDNGKEELRIYMYTTAIATTRYFRHITKSRYYTNDPTKACIFLVPVWNFNLLNPPNFSTILEHWNSGLNHVFVSFADKYGANGPTGDELGHASIMASDIQETLYRPGFDISIPLPGHRHMRELQSVKPRHRKYFATFKGLRYVGYKDDGVLRSRKEFREMHNGVDVIVATTCEHPTNNAHRVVFPDLGVHCEEDGVLHGKYTFEDLMNTTFALVPAGRSPASYRFIEVISAGAIPVLIADNYVKPFDTLIRWHTCLLQFPSSEIRRVVRTLRVMKSGEVLKRQESCLRIYEEFLKDDESLLRSAVRSLKARFLGAIPNLGEVD